MNKQLFFIPLLAFAFMTISCGSNRIASTGTHAQVERAPDVIAPQNLGNTVSEVIILAGREDESRFQVEIFAGKDMLVDCNLHTLMGQFEESFAADGSVNLTFTTNGQVISTQMACIDDTRHLAFVTAQPHMMRYNSAAPIRVRAPQGISVKYRIWEAGITHPISPMIPAIQNIATQSLSAFPTEMTGFNRFVLILPEVENEGNRKLEIIPGKVAYVDCNRHILGGTFSRRTVDGWGFDYIIFNSDGVMATTRMACLEPARPEFVPASQTEIVRYNSQMPIVVFAPIGFEVRYRIWEAPNL